MKQPYLTSGLLALAALGWPTLASAYDEVEVQTPGRVVGVVTLQGAPKPDAAPSMPADLAAEDRAYCAGKKPLLTPRYETDGAARLKNVVVWLEGVSKGKKLTRRDGVIANKDCRFLPHVQSLEVGASVSVENHDPVLHNTHPVYLEDNSTAFNLALPRAGQTVKKKIRRAGVLKVGCDAGHVWMRSWVHAFAHPYHAVSGADGAFVIDGIPAGKYRLHAWHEAGGELTRDVEVTAGADAATSFAFTAK